MQKFLIGLAALALLTAGWYVAWRSLLADDVARVKATITYHDAAFHNANRHLQLRADAVAPAGFPFHFRVRVTRPTLSMILGRETFAASLPFVDLTPRDSDQGSYAVTAPATFDAVFALPENAPEHYSITLSEVPQILLRAQGPSTACPNMPGLKPCDAVAADAPLVSFAADMPSNLILTVSLNGATKQIGFTFTSLAIPVFMPIPKDATGPLEIFVGMLREAMVYRK